MTPSLGARLRRFLPLLSALLFIAALWVLHRQLGGGNFAQIRRYLAALPASWLLLAVAFTVLGYLALSGYDWLGFRHLGQRLPYPRVAFASFVGYAFSNSLGHALLTGLPLRLRIYSAWQVSAEQISKVVAFCFLTTWLGYFALAGTLFAFLPGVSPATPDLPPASLRLLGAALLALVVVYFVATARRRTPLSIRGWTFALPDVRTSLGQIVLASVELTATATVLYLLLPAGGGVGYHAFLTVFLVAHLAGMLSSLPGGIGVFESAIVLLLPGLPAASVLGAVVAYRLIYYLLPLLVAALLLAGQELWRRRETLQPAVESAVETTVRWSTAVVPQTLAASTFVGGVILLFSGAAPAVPARLAWLHRVVPLPVIETSHFLSSLIGLGLLILARGLQRRINAAYFLVAGLLAVGIVLSLLRGLAYEVAITLGVVLVALLPCRSRFERRASLTAVQLTPGWVAAIGAVLAATVWLILFSYKNVTFVDDLWWRFALSGDAPRALRASVGIAVLVGVFGLLRLLRAAPPEPHRPTPAELEQAAAIARAAPRTYAQLSLLGDKSLLFDDTGTAFLMYAIEGRSWIALGGPVGPEERHRALIWRFRDLCERHGGWPVFYQVRERDLHFYIELGLSLLKIGEEGRVPLADFSLEGGARKDERSLLRKLDKAGLSFGWLEAAEVPAHIDVLRAISDDWLADKNAGEKGFSLGFFDPVYLSRFRLVVIRQGERIIAFANLLEGGGKEELTIDLMRYTADAPRGVMDYLFVNLMLWGKENGYQYFGFGMAPLAGLEEREGVPLWNRIGALIFRHGEHFYNFEGLRQYKDKFDPIWGPRYLASPGGFALPQVLTNLATLIAGGVTAVLSK